MVTAEKRPFSHSVGIHFGESCDVRNDRISRSGLYYGAWISQQLVRDINQGEYLLHKQTPDDRRDPLRTLSVLHLTFDEWNWRESPQPQFREYCRWMKQSILRGHPVIFVVYLFYSHDPNYDHIMPAVGVRFREAETDDPDDVLIYYNLFHDKTIEREMSEKDLVASRKTCRKHCGEGGCIPRDVSAYLDVAIAHVSDVSRLTTELL